MKRLLLFLAFLIPLVTFGQDDREHTNWCGFQAIQKNELQPDVDGPYTPYDQITPKVIPVVMRGINYYDGQFDDYVECVEIADSLIYYLNLYFSGGFEGNQINGYEPAQPLAPNARYWFVKANKAPNCVDDPSIFWQSTDDRLGQLFPLGSPIGGTDQQYLYEPFENLNIIWANFGGALGYSYVNNQAGNNPDQGYGIYMLDKLFDPNHNLDNGWQGNLTPLQLTAGVLAHEAGHWLGLYHTFSRIQTGPGATYSCGNYDTETDCNTQGDKVCDTPVDIYNFACPLDPQCSGGISNIIYDQTNFMSYRFPRCLEGRFTQNQIERSHDHAADIPMLASIVENGSTCYFNPAQGPGCTDPTACNYNPWAETDDGTCLEFDIVNVCGGGCTEDIDGDFICDTEDNCTDITKCNYNLPSNLPCAEIDDCGICGGPGATYECGCYDPVFPFCNCFGQVDFDNDGQCDNFQDYPNPGGNQLNPTECAIPNDIALTLDVSGSISQTDDASVNAVSVSKAIINYLYQAILENKVRVSISLWGSTSDSESRGSKIVVPLQGGQEGWNVLNTALDYLQESNSLSPSGPLLGEDSDQTINTGTEPVAMFGASYISLTDEDYYEAGRIKNIISITDCEWDYTSPCTQPSFSPDNVPSSLEISQQIKNSTFVDFLEYNFNNKYWTWPIPGDQTFSATDSVKCRIIGVGLGPSNMFGLGNSQEDIECWLNNDYQNLVDLASNSSSFAAFNLSDISAITDSLTIVCEVPDPDCPIMHNDATVNVDEQNQIEVRLYGNLESKGYEYFIALLQDDGTWYEIDENDVEIIFNPGNIATLQDPYHQYTFTLPAQVNWPTNIKIIYREFGFECEEELDVSCESLSGYPTNDPKIDIHKNGFGFFDPTQDKIRIVGNPNWIEIFVSPVNDCGVLGLVGSEALSSNGNCQVNQTHSVQYVTKVLPQDIVVTNLATPPLLVGNIHDAFNVNSVLEVDLTSYLQTYDMENQDMAVIVFPVSNLDFPNIDENNYDSQYENEFDALVSIYGESGIESENLNYYQSTSTKTQCVQAYVLNNCEEIFEQTHLLLFESYTQHPVANTFYGGQYELAGWPDSEEYFLLYQGTQEAQTSGEGWYGMLDPYMTSYGQGAGGVSIHINGQTFYPQRIVVPSLSPEDAGPLTFQYLSDINYQGNASDVFPANGNTNSKDYIWAQIPAEIEQNINNSDPVHVRYVPGLRQYLEDNNFSIENVEIRFPHGCSNNPPPPIVPGPCADASSIVYHSQSYGLIEIGNRCWFDRELRTSRFSNGDNFGAVEDPSTWASFNESENPAWTYPTYQEDVFANQGWSGQGYVINDQFLGGRLYNWWTVQDERNICPAGFHVSNNSDWNDLEKTIFGARSNKLSGQSNAINFLDNEIIENLQTYGFLDEFSLIYPGDPSSVPSGRGIEGYMADEFQPLVVNQNHGLAGGIRVGVDGTFRESRTARYWWVAEEYPNKPLEFNRQKAAWARGIKIVPDANDPSTWDNSDDGLSRYRDLWSTSQNKGNGLYIRCVKDLE